MKNFYIVILIIFSTLGLASETNEKVILFIGDSLTAGYGVSQKSNFPSLIGNKLKSENISVKIVNASISGSTSASSHSRLRFYKKLRPSILFLALGANDGLRGVPAKQTKLNLEKTIQLAQSWKTKVILAGMKVPPNYGEVYRREFEAMYPALAKKYKVTLVPFLLHNVAGEKSLNQGDGIHPNEAGNKIMAETVYTYLRPLL
jgi:acyl-CoA thioesterase-1